MISSLRKHYKLDRVKLIDPDFLEFEETQAPAKDLELLVSLLQHSPVQHIKLDNPHNSTILYLLGLTDQFDFSRGRSDTKGGAPPDIDIDFDTVDRPKAIEWVVNKWGRDNVANIITHGTFKPKSIFKKYYSVTEGSTTDLAEILKGIPKPKFGKEPSLEMVAEASPSIPTKYPKVWESAEKLEDMVSHFGIHAAGIVISDFPIMDSIPVWSNSHSERITQFDKDEIEALGLIKFDFLGIDSLSILKEACRLVKAEHNVDIDIYSIPDGDPKAYEALTKGMFAGVFQMEGPGASVARAMFQEINPSSVEMISDVSALNRPGPQQAGLDTEYVQNRKSGEKPSSMPDAVAKVLQKTFYTLVYQEQIMELCSVLAGFTLKEADDIRRAMGKKKKEELERYESAFLAGCKAKGLVSEHYGKTLWGTLLGFADYCFNLSHSIAYAYLAYVTVWIKTHYPAEFFCALMTVRSQVMSPKNWRVRASEYVSEARQLGILVSPPSINHSIADFSVSGTQVLFGIAGIRDVGEKASKHIISVRGKRPFSTVLEFLERVNLQVVNTKVFTALVRAGAFDRLGYIRSELLDATENLYGYVRGVVEYEERKIAVMEREAEIVAQAPLLEERDQLKKRSKKKDFTASEQELLDQYKDLRKLVPLKLGEPPVQPSLVQHSKIPLGFREIMDQADHIGCYLGQHPSQLITTRTTKLGDAELGDLTVFGGVVSDCKVITTRASKQEMAFMTMEDSTDAAEVVIFASTWSKVKGLKPGDLVTVAAEVESLEPLKLKARAVDLYRRNE